MVSLVIVIILLFFYILIIHKFLSDFTISGFIMTNYNFV